jgi:Ca-activated chloride channel family protein
VSFGAPLFLLGLLLVPVGVWAYTLHARSHDARAARWGNPALLPAVAPTRPGWRRHAPVALYAIALTALLIGLARPERTVAVPVEQATVVLATDVSGSMLARDVAPNRLTAVRNAADRMVERLPRRVRAGLVAFNHNAQLVQAPTSDHRAVRRAIRGLESSGGTAVGDGIVAALNAIRSGVRPGQQRPPAAILLLGDGESTRGRDEIGAAREARRQKVPIYTIALGTATGTIEVPHPSGTGTRTEQVPPDPEALRQIAQITGGRTFRATAADELDAIYQRLGSQVAHKDEKREVTAAFAGGALALLFGGALMSLRWFGRLP